MSKSQKHLVIWTVILVLVVFLLLRGWIAGLLMEKAVETNNIRIAKVAAAISHTSINTILTLDEFGISKESVLCAAMELHHKSVAEYLINAGASVNVTGTSYHGPLHLAVEWGDVDLVDLLLTKHADPNMVDRIGDTPLIVAVINKNEQIIGLLLTRGADVNLIDSRGDSPIDYAVAFGGGKITALLRSHGASDKVPEILEYSASGDLVGIRKVLKLNPSMVHYKGIYGMRPIHYASNYGQTAAVKLLIKKGAYPDFKALKCAVASGNTATVQIIVDQGCDVNKTMNANKTALEVAVDSGNAKMVQYLLGLGADPSIPTAIGYTIEKYARQKGNADVIKVFEAHKAGKNINPQIPVY